MKILSSVIPRPCSKTEYSDEVLVTTMYCARPAAKSRADQSEYRLLLSGNELAGATWIFLFRLADVRMIIIFSHPTLLAVFFLNV